MESARQLRLLAVDDDAASAELIVRVAERCGYEAFATSDSRGVINLVKALAPHIMAVDINMPNIDAGALLGLLAEQGYQGRIMIVSGEDETMLRRMQAHAEQLGLTVPCVHQKPLDFAKLRQMLAAGMIRTAA